MKFKMGPLVYGQIESETYPPPDKLLKKIDP